MQNWEGLKLENPHLLSLHVEVYDEEYDVYETFWNVYEFYQAFLCFE